MAKYGDVEIVPGDVVVIVAKGHTKTGCVTHVDCNSVVGPCGPQWNIEFRDCYDQPVYWKQHFDCGEVAIAGKPEAFKGVGAQAWLSRVRAEYHVVQKDADDAYEAWDGLFDNGGRETADWTEEKERELDRKWKALGAEAVEKKRTMLAVEAAVGYVNYMKL